MRTRSGSQPDKEPEEPKRVQRSSAAASPPARQAKVTAAASGGRRSASKSSTRSHKAAPSEGDDEEEDDVEDDEEGKDDGEKDEKGKKEEVHSGKGDEEDDSGQALKSKKRTVNKRAKTKPVKTAAELQADDDTKAAKAAMRLSERNANAKANADALELAHQKREEDALREKEARAAFVRELQALRDERDRLDADTRRMIVEEGKEVRRAKRHKLEDRRARSFEGDDAADDDCPGNFGPEKGDTIARDTSIRGARKQNEPWSAREELALLFGMALLGDEANVWVGIQRHPRLGRVLWRRSNVDLKDKAAIIEGQRRRGVWKQPRLPPSAGAGAGAGAGAARWRAGAGAGDASYSGGASFSGAASLHAQAYRGGAGTGAGAGAGAGAGTGAWAGAGADADEEAYEEADEAAAAAARDGDDAEAMAAIAAAAARSRRPLSARRFLFHVGCSPAPPGVVYSSGSSYDAATGRSRRLFVGLYDDMRLGEFFDQARVVAPAADAAGRTRLLPISSFTLSRASQAPLPAGASWPSYLPNADSTVLVSVTPELRASGRLRDVPELREWFEALSRGTLVLDLELSYVAAERREPMGRSGGSGKKAKAKRALDEGAGAGAAEGAL